MKFSYRARTSEGKTQAGTVVASDQARAEQLLTENNLIIVSLQILPETMMDRVTVIFNRVKTKDIVLFSRQLATLISARVPILQSLRILEDQITNKYLLSVIKGLIASVEGGQSLSLAMSQYPNVFGNVYVSLVKSGEASGSMDKSLTYLADQLEKDYELGSKVKGALTYPVFVLCALGIVGILMFKFVLPNLTSVLIQQGGTLPTVSVMLIAVTNFFNQYWWALFLALAFLILGVRFYIGTVSGRRNWDAMKIHLPLVGDIFRKIYLSRFARNLSTLVRGGIPIIQSLTIVSDVVNNEVYHELIMASVVGIQNGKNISDSLAGNPEFPSIVIQMIRVGEQTAQLDDILLKLAVFYEKEVDAKVGTLTTLLEPLIMILLGLGVGALVAGVLLPIYNLAGAGG